MLNDYLNGMDTGYKDIHGKPLRIGDHIRSRRGHIGIIVFGIYDGHYGIYINWIQANGADKHLLRKDFLFWAKEISREFS